MSATTASEIKTESPYTFQNGLSSSTSYMTFIASITERNAPEMPQRASRIEMIAPKVKALSAWLWVMLKELALDKLRRRCQGPRRESSSTMVLTRSVALKTQQREQEGEKREDGEERLVGEVAREGHDAVLRPSPVRKLEEVDEAEVLWYRDLGLVALAFGLLDQLHTRYLHASVLP